MSNGGEESRKNARISALADVFKTEKIMKQQQQQGGISTAATNADQPSGSRQPLPERKRGQKKKRLEDVNEGITIKQGHTVPTQKLPEKRILEFILDVLQTRDTREIFAQPVDPNEVDRYYEIVKEPMDFGTMRAKLQEGMYATLENFENDVYLIFKNAMMFNSSTTIYFKQARAINEIAKRVFHTLKTDPENFEMEFSLANKRCKRPKGEAESSKAGGSRRSSGKLSGGRNINLPETDRRLTYRMENNSTVSSVYTSPKLLLSVNEGMGYTESLLRFAKNLGPTALKVAMKKAGVVQPPSSRTETQPSISLPQSQAHSLQVPRAAIPAPMVNGPNRCLGGLENFFGRSSQKSKVSIGGDGRMDINNGGGHKGKMECFDARRNIQSTLRGQKAERLSYTGLLEDIPLSARKMGQSQMGSTGLLENIPLSARGKMGWSQMGSDLPVTGIRNLGSPASVVVSSSQLGGIRCITDRKEVSEALLGKTAANTRGKMDIAEKSRGTMVQTGTTYLHGVPRRDTSHQNKNQMGTTPQSYTRKEFRNVLQVEKPISTGGNIPSLTLGKTAQQMNTSDQCGFVRDTIRQNKNSQNTSDQRGFVRDTIWQNQNSQLKPMVQASTESSAFAGNMGTNAVGVMNFPDLSKGKVVQTMNKADQSRFVRRDTLQDQLNQLDTIAHSSSRKDFSSTLQGSGILSIPNLSKEKMAAMDAFGSSQLEKSVQLRSNTVKDAVGSSQFKNSAESRSNSSCLLPSQSTRLWNFSQATTSSQNLGGGEGQINAQSNNVKVNQNVEWTQPMPWGPKTMNELPTMQDENPWELETLVPLDLQIASTPREPLVGKLYEMTPLQFTQGESSVDQSVLDAEKALLDFQLPDLDLQL